MKIDSLLIKESFNIVTQNINCDHLGLVGYETKPNTLSFIDSENYIGQVNANENIKALFITKELAKKFNNERLDLIICEDPRYYFYTLYNLVSEKNYVKKDTKIDPTARIHDKAFVSEFNVIIGKNTVIEPNVTILPDVVIGNNCHIMAGAVIGSSGFEYKRTSKGIIPVFHDGKAILHDNVDAGANATIDKGFSFKNTEIGSGTKLDNLVYIAHAVNIGENCLLAAGCAVMGSVKIMNNVWVGPNATIAPRLTIGSNAFITLGAAVTKDVSESEMVSGVFAVPHKKFIENLKKSAE